MESFNQWKYKNIVFVFSLSLIYFISGKLGLKLAFVNESATVVWVPTGIAIASFLLLGFRIWPAIFLGAFLTNFTTNGTIATSFGIALGNTLEGIIAAFLIKRFAHGSNTFYHVEDFFKFTILVAVLSVPISATIGVLSLILGGFAQWSEFISIWLTWWTGDVSGALIIVPFIIFWKRKSHISWNKKKVLEALMLMCVLFAVSITLFGPLGKLYPLEFLSLPIIIWIAFRFGARETITAIVLLTGIAIWGTLNGFGPFVRQSPNESLLLLQIFMNTMTITVMTLSIAIAERKHAVERYQSVLGNMIEGFQIIGFDWKYLYVNDAVALQGQKSKEKLLGHTMMEAYPGIEKTELFTYIKRCMEIRSAHQMENEFTYPDGHKRWFELRIEPISEGIFILSLDITERRAHEEQVGRIASIVESSDDAIIGKDLEGMITSWNAAAERLYGYSEHEIIGKSIMLIFPDDKKNEFEDIMGKIRKAENIRHFETKRRRKDGKIIDVSVTISPIKNSDGVVIGASSIGRDITDRKKAEEALRESEEHFRALVNATSNVVYRMSPDWSEMHELQGRKFLADTGEPISDWLQKYIDPKDQEHVMNVINQAIKTKSVFQLEHQVKQVDGTLGWTFSRAIPILDKDGEIVEWFGAASDITKRKKQEEELSRLAAIVESSEEAIIGKNLDGIITTWNKGAENLYGYSAEEMIGKPNKILVPQDHAHEWNEFMDTLSKGEIIKNFETVRVHKDGRRIDVSITFSPIKDNAGSIIGVSAIVRDITERKKVDEMKNEFVALASHQLKTPLTSIKWYSELLLKDVTHNFTEKQINYLHEIHRSNKRMIYLINALLNVSRIDLGTFIVNPVESNLSEIIDGVIKDFAVQIAARNIHVEKTYDVSLPSLLLDENVMRIILSNLILNAIRYSTINGKIFINVIQNDEQVHINVADNGIGIPLSQKDKIFKKFSRADNAMVQNTDGSGLGLYIVKSLVDRCGGTITFTSEENKGTEFTVSFPLTGMKEKEGTRQLQ